MGECWALLPGRRGRVLSEPSSHRLIHPWDQGEFIVTNEVPLLKHIYFPVCWVLPKTVLRRTVRFYHMIDETLWCENKQLPQKSRKSAHPV